MWPCPRCFELTYFDHKPICDFSPEELEEIQEELRDQAGRPDADYHEVTAMLCDPHVVVYRDPFELYGEENE